MAIWVELTMNLREQAIALLIQSCIIYKYMPLLLWNFDFGF